MTNSELSALVNKWRKFLGDPLILPRFLHQAFYGGLWRAAWVITAPLFRHWAGKDHGNVALGLGDTRKAGLIVESVAAHQENARARNYDARAVSVDLYLVAEEFL